MQIKFSDLKYYNARIVIVADIQVGVFSHNSQTVLFFFVFFFNMQN